jgi:5'-deoxynucleotidase YfbR-like HD superfamily hydrolase
MNTLKLLESGRVQRYHCAPVTMQPLSDHSWQVALILLDFYPEASKELITHALVHDCGEIHTGDMPSTYKADNPDLAASLRKDESMYLHDHLQVPIVPFTEREVHALKMADILSGLYHTAYDAARGNLLARSVYKQFYTYYLEQPYFNQRSMELMEEITNVIS